MNEQLIERLTEMVERLGAAAASLEDSLQQSLGSLAARQEQLSARIEHLVAAVEEPARCLCGGEQSRRQLETRVAELERANQELKAQAGRASENAARKTLPPLVTTLLSKSGVETEGRIDPASLDKSLAGLSVEQRIAVKAQMARAGLIE